MSNNTFNFKNEKLKQLVEFLVQHPNVYTHKQLAEMFGLSIDAARNGVNRARQKYILITKEDKPEKFSSKRQFIEVPTPPNTERVLVIGDIHAPFALEEYLDFCFEQYKKYKCTHVIFIGDLVDNHAVSYHESDPDGLGAGEELEKSIEDIAKWYKVFPKADVTTGNHDRLIMRKAFSGNIPRRWILSYQDMFSVPGWNFGERFVYNDVQYIHGEGGTARARAKKDMMSTVQGHLHTQAYTEHMVGANYHVFGSQVGCGVDRHTYAMAYAKDYGKPAIGCMVILDSGKLPINIMAEL